MENSPIVSVIIPSFNREALITETLQSVSNQTYTNWECLIIDDGSTDGTKVVVHSFVDKDSRFKWVERHREPKGAPTCRNIGIEISEGEYVIFLDSDDLLADFCLEKRVEHFRLNPTLDFVVFNILGFKKKPGDYNLLWNVLDKDEDDLYRFLISDTPWATPSAIWKKDSLIRLGGWDVNAKNWQDWEFHIRALIAGYSYIKIDSKEDCFFRCDHEEIAISKNERQIQHLKSRVSTLNNLSSVLHRSNVSNPQYTEAIALQYFRICVFLKEQEAEHLSIWSKVKSSHLIPPFWHYLWLIYLKKEFYKQSKLRAPLKRVIDKILSAFKKRHFWANPTTFKRIMKDR
ncbi:glycosyltransferase [Reichenbachiella sp. 5M10]|uniref:glycosyltransferase family 2 protein n=1 Tax=Reichenbachiella sp. 5M10 TaxID=1889772 RepID=UPI0013046BB4|nr:glycosyltransferase [Reichenbachiella sp. 5M10]